MDLEQISSISVMKSQPILQHWLLAAYEKNNPIPNALNKGYFHLYII